MMDSIIDDAMDNSEDENASAATDAVEQSAETGSESNPSGNVTDDELMEVMNDLQTNITVVGCGGAGCNTMNRMVEAGIEGAKLVALNTDVQDLVELDGVDEKLLVGREKTGGRGAGSVPQVGEESALENQEEIRDSISGSDMVFVTAGMGGGTGTGAAPVVAQCAKDEGALTIAIVTTPFAAEGQVRRTNADAGLERLRDAADTVIVVPNDRLLETVGDLPVRRAFKVSDEVLMRSVKGITELITKPGLVNLDFADVRTVMEGGGVALIGLGESDSATKGEDSVRKAMQSPLLDVDISGATSVLVNVTGGPDMQIEEAEGVVEHLHDQVDPDSRIIWGTSVDDEFKGKMRTMLVVTGVESPQIYGGNGQSSAQAQTQTQTQTEQSSQTENAGQFDSSAGQETQEDFSDIDYVE